MDLGLAGLYEMTVWVEFFAVVSQNAPDKSSPIDKQKYIYSRNLVFKETCKICIECEKVTAMLGT